MRISRRHILGAYTVFIGMLHTVLLSLNANYYIHSDIEARAESIVAQWLATHNHSAQPPSPADKSLSGINCATISCADASRTNHSMPIGQHDASASALALLRRGYTSRVFSGMTTFLLCQVVYCAFALFLGLYTDHLYARLVRPRLLHRSALRQMLVVLLIGPIWAASFVWALWPTRIPLVPSTVNFTLFLCFYDMCAALCHAAVKELVLASGERSDLGRLANVDVAASVVGEEYYYSGMTLDGNVNLTLERSGVCSAMVACILLCSGAGWAHYTHDAQSNIDNDISNKGSSNSNTSTSHFHAFHCFIIIWSTIAALGLVLCFLCLHAMQSRQRCRKQSPQAHCQSSAASYITIHGRHTVGGGGCSSSNEISRGTGGCLLPGRSHSINNLPLASAAVPVTSTALLIRSNASDNNNNCSGKTIPAATGVDQTRMSTETKRSSSNNNNISATSYSNNHSSSLSGTKGLLQLYRFALQTTHRPCMKAVMIMCAWQQYMCTCLSQFFIALMMYASGDSASLLVRVLALMASLAAPYALSLVVAALCGALGNRTTVTLLVLLRVIISVTIVGIGVSLLRLTWEMQRISSNNNSNMLLHQSGPETRNYMSSLAHDVGKVIVAGHALSSSLVARSRNYRIMLGLFIFILRLVTESVQSTQSAVMRDVVDEDTFIFGHTKPRDAEMRALITLARRPLQAAALWTGYFVLAQCSGVFDESFAACFSPSASSFPVPLPPSSLPKAEANSVWTAVRNDVSESARYVQVLPSMYVKRVLYYTATAKIVALYVGVIYAVASVIQLVAWLRHYNLHGSHLHFVKMATQKIEQDHSIKHI